MSEYRIGAGIYDITGSAAEAGMFGYAKPGQLTSGIHMRLRSRAFVFHDIAHDTYCALVSADIGQVTESIMQAVVGKLETLNVFCIENVMVSAVHTHCAPGGLSHYPIYNMHPPLKGFDQEYHACVANGIATSIKRAYVNLQPACIREAVGDCMNASVNRSIDAYNANPAEERAEYQYDTDKSMTLWRFDGLNGYPIGMINWFAVHPTSMGNEYTLITGDNKGYASHVFENEMGTNHLLDRPRSFVAAFAQSNEGDVSPNIKGPRTCQTKDFESMKLNANLQVQTARELYTAAANEPPLSGPIQYRHQYIDFSNIHLQPEWHQYTDCHAKTSQGCIGISMLAGTAFDGKGVHRIPEGVKWGDYRSITLCPTMQNEQKEKLVVFPTGYWGLTPSVLPLQLFTIGQRALAATPFEITTMAGRRLRNSITKSLESVGIGNTIIVGLANGYAGYMTTREEYSVQRYEGASTHFGPNQLSATMQQFDELSLAIIEGSNIATIPSPNINIVKPRWGTPVLIDNVPKGAKFGQIMQDACPFYKQGDKVIVTFHSGHPKNNFRTQDTFLEIHRKVGNTWVSYKNDGDVDTTYRWERVGIHHSKCTITWQTTKPTPKGIYRIKHIGDHKSPWRNATTPYFGFSSPFKIKM